MPNNALSYQVQDVPPFIQEILMKYGEKTPIGSEEFIRSFNEVVLKKLSDEKFEENMKDIKKKMGQLALKTMDSDYNINIQ